MGTQGFFGYIIGKKKRIIQVQYDADLLWQILVREIYILMKHFKTKESLQEAFETIKTTKSNPKLENIEKCKIFTNFEIYNSINNEDISWKKILHFCQSSYINILEAGYIINEKEENGLIFMLDFNKGSVKFYNKDLTKKIQEFNSATIEEIMEFDEMPTKSYKEIVSEMEEKFIQYYTNLSKIDEEINKLNNIKKKAQEQCAINIELKVKNLLDEMEFERTNINMGRRVFYNRLQALDLIEEEK